MTGTRMPALPPTMYVVDSDDDDDGGSDDDVDYKGEGVSAMHGINTPRVFPGGLGQSDELSDEEDVVYRGILASSTPVASPVRADALVQTPRLVAAANILKPDMLVFAPGKRQRSYTSELAAEPLHAAKHHSNPPSRASPSAEQMRITQLRQLIETEQADREALLSAYQANEALLKQLIEQNAVLRGQLAAAKAAFIAQVA